MTESTVRAFLLGVAAMWLFRVVLVEVQRWRARRAWRRLEKQMNEEHEAWKKGAGSSE